MKMKKFFIAIWEVMLKSFCRLKNDVHGFIDVGTGIAIGVLFAGLMIVAYIIWTLKGQLITESSTTDMNSSIQNITTGFDSTITLFLVVVIVWLLALAIMALLVIKKNST